MKWAYPPYFESGAEKAIFPIFYSYALKNHLVMEYQYSITTEPEEDWWKEYGWEKKEKYRIDFTFEGRRKDNSKIKLAVEIDGKEWHKNIFKEENKRDYYLKKIKNYTVIHIPAKDVWNGDKNPKGIIKTIQTLNEHTGYEYFH